MRERVSSFIGIGLVCGLFLLLGLPSLNQMIIYTPDSARYLAWANSLAQFDGFKDMTTPEPSRYVVHAPLYPILLAPGAFLFPQSVVAAKTTTLIIGILTIFMFYVWARNKAGEQTALLGSLLLALNPLMLIYSTQILSDIPFAFCFILLFYFTEKMTTGEYIPERTEYLSLAILTIGVFVRDIGLTLMAGATLFFLWKKQYRRAAYTCLVPLLLYLVWFIRNEVMIAGAENPSIRNSHIFLMHLYTSNQESLLVEFGLRLWNNLILYTEMSGKLLFMPDFAQRSLSLVTVHDPFVRFLFTIMPIGRLFLIGATVGFCGIGFWRDLKNKKSFLLISIVLLCYLVPILFYPINDIRFLFPCLIIMVYFCAVGIKYSDEWWSDKVKFRGTRFIVIGAVVLILIPNIAWLQSYVRSSYRYGQSAEELYSQMKTETEYPGQFAKPLHLAGKWIVQHHESPVVVLTRWKELAFWLQGNKVIEAHPQIPPDTFDCLLRDYSVNYIVAVETRVGLNEFESLMNRSRRYQFIPVYRAGDVEILEVKPQIQLSSGKVQEQTADSTVRSVFRHAMALMEGNPLDARRLLEQIPVRIGGYSEILFHRGVAMEFAGELDSAVVQFEKFRLMPQAGAYLQQSWIHLELISRLRTATASPNTIRRAEIYQTLAVNYWELGYRKRAMNLLVKSLEAEQEFLPALITSALFSFQQGDTAAAWMNLTKARSLQSDNILTAGLTAIQQNCELLQRSNDRAQQLDLRLKVVDSFIAMGLREQAIDDLMDVLKMDPANQRALQLLGESFEVKQRYGPALKCYNTILLFDVTNRDARQKVNNLRARF